MSSYNYLSILYDTLTQDVKYEVRSDYISDFFKAENLKIGTLVDLGCGTCSISIPFAKKGISVIGVDCSEEMLSVASQKIINDNLDVSLINSKMQDFVYPDGCDAVLCSLDGINHLLDQKDVISTFKNVYSYLNKGGMFIFDANTIYKHQKVLFDNTFIFDEDDYYLVWDNEQVDDVTVRILLDLFIYNGESYDRYSEEFFEKAYSTDEIIYLLKDAGFNNIKIFGDLSLNAPKENEERIYFVCKKD